MLTLTFDAEWWRRKRISVLSGADLRGGNELEDWVAAEAAVDRRLQPTHAA